ncbi:MAG: flippase [Candidatus Hodarchaeota archaeon]
MKRKLHYPMKMNKLSPRTTPITKNLVSGKILARNTILNFIGQATPLLVGVITIPFILQGLGKERFGILALAWIVLGYFTIFDLGLGRATTKFVAEALGKRNHQQIPTLVWTAVTVQLILGILGAIFLFVLTPILVESILKIPPELVSEAMATFYLLALSIPIVLVSSSFRGVLEAAQRFDLVNFVKIPSNVLTYLLPLVGLYMGFNLPGIIALILIARTGALVAYIIIDLQIAPALKNYAGSLVLFPQLFKYGGWITVTSVISPILVHLDRFLIGSLLSMAAVAYYTAPFEAVTRLSIIAASLSMTLFPAFSSLEGIKDQDRLSILFARSIKYVFLILGPCILVIGLFAKEILRIWLGIDFAVESPLVLQILSIGVLVNSLARTPFALLQGVGRPDLPAKFHLLELPIYTGMAWLLVSKLGINGAALAWTFRVALDAAILFYATFKVCKFSTSSLLKNGTVLACLALLLFAAIAYGLKLVIKALPLCIQISLIVIPFVSFALIVWKKILDDLDRRTILSMMKFS